MTTTTLTLTDFLLARIAEDEAAARRSTGISPVAEVMSGARPRSRWLAECSAKRRVVEWCGEREMIWVGTLADDREHPSPDQFVPGPLRHPSDSVALRFLAAVYADHPDFRDEWR